MLNKSSSESCVHVELYQHISSPGTDYNRIRRDIVFNADNTEVCVSISILDDITVEGTETFSITLTTEEPVFTIATTTVNIVDDGKKTST